MNFPTFYLRMYLCFMLSYKTALILHSIIIQVNYVQCLHIWIYLNNVKPSIYSKQTLHPKCAHVVPSFVSIQSTTLHSHLYITMLQNILQICPRFFEIPTRMSGLLQCNISFKRIYHTIFFFNSKNFLD
jgi:hypothetical protein